MKKISLFASILIPVVTLVPFVTTSCSKKSDGLTQISHYINERTFTIGMVQNNSTIPTEIGTAWLFYHIPSDEANDDYSFYALTNVHVATSITNASLNYYGTDLDNYYFYGFQTDEDISESKRIAYDWDNIYSETKSTASNQLNYLDSWTYISSTTAGWKNTGCDNFAPMYDQYIECIYNDKKYYNFLDMEVIKLDFSDAVELADGQELKERLDDLCQYGENNNNYLVNFMEKSDYENITNEIDNNEKINVYTGGFPLRNNKGELINSDNSYSFKFHELSSVSYGFQENSTSGGPYFSYIAAGIAPYRSFTSFKLLG